LSLDIIQDNQEKPWYRQGLKFKCTQCGKCCTGSPGYTWVSENEIIALADYLRLSIEEFAKKYLRKVGARWSLLEDRRNWDCIFLKDGKCTVYPVRPNQCKTYPWWPDIVATPESWEREAVECEGIDKGDKPVDRETIDAQLASHNSPSP